MKLFPSLTSRAPLFAAAAATACTLFSTVLPVPAQLPATEPEPPAARPAAPPPKPPMPPPPKPAAPRTPESAITPANRNPGRHADFLERIKQGPVGLLFLGDSITDGWNRRGEWTWSKFAPYQPANFGVSGERTEDVLWRIQNGELEGINPKVTVIMIGTNNIGHFQDEQSEWVAAGINKIVQTVHAKLPDTKILLLGIFPRDNAESKYRTQITEINTAIARLDDGKKTRFLDINKVFLDAQGQIPRDVMPDGLHPNPKGYLLWYDAMQPPLGEMLK